ncbi:MAG: efflux RND transporter periplasmic adaptor subunit, partial [Candidatus Ratteibacteria bacterium]
PGRTSAFLVAEVRPQVNGIVQKRLFTEGGNVKQGDILYQIDSAPYQAAYDSAAAALARAESALLPLRLRAERYKELLAVKAVGQQDYDDVVAVIKQGEADVQYYKAAVESARINLGYTQITAPVTGRIGRSSVTVGALATAHQGSAFATIQQINPIYVDAVQSSADLLQLRRNLAAGRLKDGSPNQTRAKLLLEDGTPYPLAGNLNFSDITVDPNTGSVTLRMLFPNPQQILLPGMYVRAVVQEGVADRAILVPQQAVSRDAKGIPTAMVLNNSGMVEQRVLKIDRAIGNKWMVSEGLKQGDRVIIEGLQRIQAGSPAKVATSAAKTGAVSPSDKTIPVAAK